MSEPEGIPFSNAREYLWWDSRNCARCESLADCELTDMLALGTVTGTVPVELAEEYGAETTREAEKTYVRLPSDCPRKRAKEG
jgi:hypothetical protein